MDFVKGKYKIMQTQVENFAFWWKILRARRSEDKSV